MLKLLEIPNQNWTISAYLELPIDRGGPSAREYLRDKNVVLERKLLSKTDQVLMLHTGRQPTFKNFLKFALQNSIGCFREPLHFIAEPHEVAPLAYEWLPRERTYSLAPYDPRQRFLFPLAWQDPQLENWSKRLDRIVWFARPYGWRVEIAKKFLAAGVPLDVYSYEKWPLETYKGPAQDYESIARQYRYQLVYEPSKTSGFHSEKFFKSIASGCVTFFDGERPDDLPHLDELSLEVSFENLMKREEFADQILMKMSDYLFSERWKIYSSRAFFDRILDHVKK